MALQFFNTYSRRCEPFVPLDPAGRRVSLYTCGPTVYNFAHIGNFRAYVFEDLLQRQLVTSGFSVDRVMNLTDVDDKTIRGAQAAGAPLAAFTQPFKDAFFEDCQTLRLLPAAHYPAATEPVHIARMISMIRELEGKGIAYQAEDKSVYFRLSRFPDYGRLAHLNLEELRPTGRIQNDEYEKESVGDFALWKAWTAGDGDVAWESPWGRGRPGWHIECSAMATALLGPEIDIHCGGVDNIFPHHEAEIAQSESCTGRKFVRYWLHCAHLMVEGQKMAKKLGNFFTLRDLLEKGYTGREIRFVLLTAANYRLPLNFTFASLDGARTALARIDEWLERIGNLAAGNTVDTPLSAHVTAFFASLDDDLNISGAMGHLFDLVRDSNRAMDAAALPPGEAGRLLEEWRKMDQVLAIGFERPLPPPEVLALATERETARGARDWPRSDALRDRLLALGWVVKDTKTGPQLVSR